jgi:hypothetical protein
LIPLPVLADSTRPLLLALGGFVAACGFTRANPDHCANNGGDAYCAALDAGRGYCALDHCGLYETQENVTGCVADKPVDVDPSCFAPCGAGDPGCMGGSGETGSSGTTPSTTTTTEATSTTGVDPTDDASSSTTTGASCDDDEDCDSENARFCVDGACASCAAEINPDQACASLGAGTDVCKGGVCVQCTAESNSCGGDTPVCDATGTCTACRFHEECPVACRIDTGACFAESAVWYVWGDTVGAQQGTAASPFRDIAQGVQAAQNAGGGVVLVRPAAAVYDEDLVIDTEAVAILHDPDVVGDVVVDQSQLSIESGARAFVQGVRFQRSGSVGVRVQGAILYLDRCEILRNAGGGIVATADSELYLRNVMVSQNGNNFDATTGLSLTNTTFELLYSTIADNTGTGSNDSLDCGAGAVGAIRNSFLASTPLNSIDCTDITVAYSVVDTGGIATLGRSNIVLTSFSQAWFAGNYEGDTHLAPSTTTPFANEAQWQQGDPWVDLDGDERPQIDGTDDWIGADVP